MLEGRDVDLWSAEQVERSNVLVVVIKVDEEKEKTI